MKSNPLLVVQEKSFFSKIKNFLKRIFSKKSNEQPVVNNKKEIPEFTETIKVDKIKEFENIETMQELANKLKNNPDLLSALSDERLDKLIEYYEKIVGEKLKVLKYD